MVMKTGEHRQYDSKCPFDCIQWDECVCENTAALAQSHDPNDVFDVCKYLIKSGLVERPRFT